MSARQDEGTAELLAAFNESITSWTRIEMRTRDEDADHYEEFFPRFQTEVELHAYSGEFSGVPCQRALDVGCGTGRTLMTLNSKHAVGVDLSRESLLLARARHGKKVSLVQASATQLPFRPGAFDRLLCAGVLNHIPGEGQRTMAIREAARVASRRARLVFSVQNYSWLARRQFPRETVQHNLFWHRFTPDEMESLFGRFLGPSKFKIRGICTLPRWRVGNRLGSLGKWLDIMLSRVGWLSRRHAAILVVSLDCIEGK